MNRVEEASLKGRSQEDIDRLLHMMVVGGGPTGVEVAAELQDFFKDDLQKLVPQLKDKLRVTLIEALPTVRLKYPISQHYSSCSRLSQILPMFTKQLIGYAENTMQGESIKLLKSTMVKGVTDTEIEVQSVGADGQKQTQQNPYGLLVWAGGNTPHSLTRDLMMQLPEQASSRRGILVNEFLQVKGTKNVWALGDCTSTSNAPIAQVANQQGAYFAKYLNTRADVEERFNSPQQVDIDEHL
ncbi:hypothetical protein N7475_003373 [Penicillium sp. IBT 31633x]|nr:hypothetical protein N7475_003373 [Penicillium sp. IBT 31633x]